MKNEMNAKELEQWLIERFEISKLDKELTFTKVELITLLEDCVNQSGYTSSFTGTGPDVEINNNVITQEVNPVSDESVLIVAKALLNLTKIFKASNVEISAIKINRPPE